MKSDFIKEYYYENGVRKGKGELFDDYGKLGEWTWWYDNGNIKSKGRYDWDKKDGLWIYYNEDGSKKETIEYRNGKEYICSKSKNNKGEITKEYCPSNPLSSEYKEEPLYEHYGDYFISQGWKCRDFSKENNIKVED